MAATILETIAAYAKERAAKDKENVPEAVMKERALALPKGTFRFSRALRKKELSLNTNDYKDLKHIDEEKKTYMR